MTHTRVTLNHKSGWQILQRGPRIMAGPHMLTVGQLLLETNAHDLTLRRVTEAGLETLAAAPPIDEPQPRPAVSSAVLLRNASTVKKTSYGSQCRLCDKVTEFELHARGGRDYPAPVCRECVEALQGIIIVDAGPQPKAIDAAGDAADVLDALGIKSAAQEDGDVPFS